MKKKKLFSDLTKRPVGNPAFIQHSFFEFIGFFSKTEILYNFILASSSALIYLMPSTKQSESFK